MLNVVMQHANYLYNTGYIVGCQTDPSGAHKPHRRQSCFVFWVHESTSPTLREYFQSSN